MADYKELLRRAINALPENNGVARRAVYEKARAALVGQLRAITPPLSARDITQHRLQLEDCIRHVEQEATEAMIALGRGAKPAPEPVPAPAPPPVTAPEPEPEPAPAPFVPVSEAVPEPEPAPVEAEADEPPPPEASVKPEPAAPVQRAKPMPFLPPQARDPIEEIIAAVESGPRAVANDEMASLFASGEAQPGSVEPEPEPVDRAPEKSIPETKPGGVFSGFRLFQGRASAPAPAPVPAPAPRTVHGGRVEPGLGAAAAMRQAEPEEYEDVYAARAEEVQTIEAALSSVREPEPEDDTRAAEGAIERAIETLDRAARGEAPPPEDARGHEVPVVARLPAPAPLPSASRPVAPVAPAVAREAGEDEDFEEPPRRWFGSGLTIFFIVFIVLFAAVLGAGFWAWREGYMPLDQMLGRAPVVAEALEPAAAPPAQEPAAELAEPAVPPVPAVSDGEQVTAPGNTVTETAQAEPTTALQGLIVEDRLEPALAMPDPTPAPVLGPQPTALGPGSDERLTDSARDVTLAEDPAASVDPAVLAGNQSLLLEASDDGSGAVPFSGTVDWSRGMDEIGLPTLIAQANIPARNLGVRLTIRRNADPGLPASHLMEINFSVPETFIGGAIAGLPGVLLKNEELVQGTPLIGASARVVGNSFLFALSSTAADVVTNSDLLANRNWMDLAVIYATGRRAIITLEKDAAAQALFTETFAAWRQADASR